MQNDVSINIITKALLARRVEEKLLELYSLNLLNGTIHTCIGEEFSGAVITECLEKGDSIFSNHRCHGHFLSFTDDVEGLLAEIMGKESGICAGRGGSQHLCKDNFYSNGIQGGILPLAAGLALSRKMKKNNKISVVFIGDGTLGEGMVYESMNLASKWELPLFIVVENNFYSQSTTQNETLAGDIQTRAKAFNIYSEQGSTWEWEELYFKAKKMVDYVREECRPALLQIDTYRLKAHSKGDDFRPREVLEVYEKKDPLNKLMQNEVELFNRINVEVCERVEKALKVAQSSDMAKGNFKQTTYNTLPTKWEEIKEQKVRLVKALNDVMKDIMKEHENSLFIGEDVKSPYGGTFKVSQDLSYLYGERVRNTPIAEGVITGIGAGLALDGFVPMVEIMFGDFTTLAFDQILNHACKFRYMYNGQVSPNLIVRTPMGGRRGYGPTHSQTLDRHFMGIPGLRMIAINHLINPASLYKKLVEESQDCTLVIENKLLYPKYIKTNYPDGFKAYCSDEKYPTILIKPELAKPYVTIVGYGGMSDIIIKAMERLFIDHDIIAQAIIPTQIYPMNFQPLIDSIPKGTIVVVVEEGQGFAAFGTEVIAQIVEKAPNHIHKFIRIQPKDIAIPTAVHLEQEALPGVEQIIGEIVKGVDEEQ
ncbi:pyruvate/2-oxoglutarate/acetoin dehydrogenase E1 component [Ruminiclostridium sufflavum DSM 19573]|uniref:Pyruvate/2-oxoglutarate/acetoin dehydrogenase E1 component n=2 Tax=Ruminiclostridium TaxID=1508657 RepID=A0A318XIL6_9FIRM|nr:pyruvate/2-oxoglutarate/acetoin dehydrogenase E1 component [Ruminiclostridium sufflavum DSM 19573]